MSRTRRIIAGSLVVAAAVLLWWLFGTTHLAPEGIYLAGSNIKDEQALGGFGKWSNLPRDITGQNWGEAGAISLIACPDEQAGYLDLRGFALRLVNRTDKPAAFTACDSKLFLVQEALDWKGKWRPIEQMPQTFCGNSYHRVFLDRDQYWEIPAPRYSGWFRTRIRFRLEQGEERQREIGMEDENHLPPFPTRGGRFIYSNEFIGSINLSQFAAERTHQE